jgi:CRP/FNR family cyclic AMP-dependent transcriptional regulator
VKASGTAAVSFRSFAKELPLSSTLEPLPRLAPTRVARLLDEDLDLAAALTGDRLADARRRLVARVAERRAGAWPFLESHQAKLGLLVLDGVLIREILLEDSVSAELLGAGDLLRPKPTDNPSRLLRSHVRWTVLQPAQVAVLDERCDAVVAAYPELHATLLDRVTARAERLAVTQAISQLNGVDRRLLGLFWHLAERWGRVAGDGVVVPLPLPHRHLASLVGARRPTVSTALARLAADGIVVRRADGTWLLCGEPVGQPTAATARFMPLRRRTASPVG